MRVYFDSCILIYLIDDDGLNHARARSRLSLLDPLADLIVISDLTRLECRVGPLRRKDTASLALFDRFFSRPEIQTAPLSSAVFARATLVRANLGLKTPDAIHLAAAIEANCDRFLTNDVACLRCTEIDVEILP